MTTEFSTEFTSFSQEGGPPGAAPPRGLNPKRLIQLRLPLMLVVAAAIAAPAVVAVWFLVPLEFSATTNLIYSSTKNSILGDEQSVNATQYRQFLKTETNTIVGAALLSRVVARPEIAAIDWIANSADPVFTLQNKAEALVLSDTDIVEIVARAPKREDAIAIAQALEDEYMEDFLGRESQIEDHTLQTLTEQRETLEKDLSRLQDTINAMRRQVDAPMSGDGGRDTSQFTPYRQQLVEAEGAVIEATGQVERLETEGTLIADLIAQHAADPSAEVPEMGIELQVKSDPRVGGLLQGVAQIEQEIAVLRETYQGDAPQLKVATNKLAATDRRLKEAQIETRRGQLDALKAKSEFELHAAKIQLTSAEERRKKFQAMIDQNAGDEVRLSQQLADIKQYEDQRDLTQSKLQNIGRRLDELSIESRAMARVRRGGGPSAPSSPDHAKKFMLMIMACGAAVGIGFGVGLLRELTDQQVRSVRDVGYVTPLPILAAIPHIESDRLPGGAIAPMLTADHPVSTTADEFRRILTRIIYPPEGSAELNTCLIASPSRGDGKTSLACNLAVALAKANRKVLLVDISSRHPSIERNFSFEPQEGLGEILMGEASPNELVRPTQFENLFVLGPGFRGRELVGKLASRDIVEFLERAEEAFEHVIIDTPPSLLMSDAKLLAPIVDGVIMVCGVGVTTLGMLSRSLNEMRQIGANLVGVVVNGLKPQRGGYLARNLQLYYAYSDGRGELGATRTSHQQEEEEEEPMIVLLDEALPEPTEHGGEAT